MRTPERRTFLGRLTARWAVLATLFAVCAVSLIAPASAFAFKPGAHLSLLRSVVASLPPTDAFRLAYESSPEAEKAAALGACGPDLGFGQLGTALGYAPWAEALHDDKMGTATKKLLQKALDSGDDSRIAFALGYVTHIAGDLSSNGLFLRPEAGVSFDDVRSNTGNEAKRENLENAAEAYVWKNPAMGKNAGLSNYTKDTFPNEYPSSYNDVDLTSAAKETYGGGAPDVGSLTRFTSSAMKQDPLKTIIANSLKGIMGDSAANSIADTIVSIFSPLSLLNFFTTDPQMKLYQDTSAILTTTQKSEISQAYEYAKTQSVEMLTGAEANDYHAFSDSLAGDVGNTGGQPPAPNLIVRVKTGATQSFVGDTLLRHLDGPGTDDDAWVRFTMSDGSVIEREIGWGKKNPARNNLRAFSVMGIIPFPIPGLPLNLGEFDDMENGRTDSYPVYIPGIKLENVRKVGLRKAPGDGATGKWRPVSITVSLNGRDLPTVPVTEWLGEPISVDVPNPEWPFKGDFFTKVVVVGGELTRDFSVVTLWSGQKLARPTQAGAFTLKGTADGHISLAWPKPTSGYDVVILRSESKVASSPIDAIGQDLVYTGLSDTFEDTNVVSGKKYWYTRFYVNPFGVWGNAVSNWLVCPTPVPPPVTNLVGVAGNASAHLSWTNPNSTAFDHAVVVRKEASPPTSINDGLQLTLQSAAAAVDSGLSNGTTYYYGVFAVNADGNPAAPAIAYVTPTGGTDDHVGPARVTGPYFDGSAEHTMTLTWTNPADPDFTFVRVLRSRGGFAPDPTPRVDLDTNGRPTDLDPDAQWLAYEGDGTRFTDSGLQYGITYYYTVFAFDKFGNASLPATNAAPTRDATDPKTTLSGVASEYAVSPVLGWRGRWHLSSYPWSNRDVQLSLSATDSLTGVDYTMLRLDGSVDATYTGPITVTGEGAHNIEFWSFDKAVPRNTDAKIRWIKPDPFSPAILVTTGAKVYFGIDKTPPTSSCNATSTYPGPATIRFSSADALSGVSGVRYLLDSASGETTPGGSITVKEGGHHELTYWAVDKASNVESAHTVQFDVKDTTTLSLRPQGTTMAYGKTNKLNALLVSAGSADASGSVIIFEKKLSNGSWTPVGNAKATTAGSAVLSVKSTENATYRARFVGSAVLTPATSASADVKVKASLTKPNVPSSVYRTKRAYVYGYLTPRHTSGTTTKLRCYRYEHRKWVYKKSVTSTMSRSSSSRSKYSARIMLRTRGKWKIVARHSDSKHYKSYSAYSRTITVK